MITVIGTGSASADNLTLRALRKIKDARHVVLKTEKSPMAAFLQTEGITYETLDELYEDAEDFDELNRRIREKLAASAPCVYLVHGSALDDTSVQALVGEELEIIPGLSVNDCAAAAAYDGTIYHPLSCADVLAGLHPRPQEDYCITCIDSPLLAGELQCVLTEIYGDETIAKWYCETYEGVPSLHNVMLCELGREKECNHTSVLFLKKQSLNDVFRYDLAHLLSVTARLLAPDGCPWDSVQTHESLRSYLIEEAYEVAETIDKDDPYRLCDELGDVLFQVAIHAGIAQKQGEFCFDDVTDAITRKMISRHSALFSGGDANGQPDTWENTKKAEKGLGSLADVLHDVPDILPSLAYAEKIQYKARNSRDLTHDQALTEIQELLSRVEELNEDECGRLLFALVRICRTRGVHPELALHKVTLQFIEQFDTDAATNAK